MTPRKRSTVRIEEDLMIAVRRRAAAEHVSINRMINRLLRVALRAPEVAEEPFEQEVYDMGQPLVDITKANAVLAAWDDERFLRRMEEHRKR